MNKEEIKAKIIKILYLILSLLLAMPSIIYLIQNKTIYRFVYVFRYFYKHTKYAYESYISAIIYVTLFIGLFILYFLILKNINKIFKNKKSLILCIVLVAIIFAVNIPITSTDVFSYIGNGWVNANYDENPYYVSIQDTIDKYGPDTMFTKVAICWLDEPVVYGPIWSLICKILTSFSFGSVDIALFMFKLGALAAFLGCSYLIYKITNKKLFVAIFALNPFILFEALSNVHNDIFLILFILLAIYFVKNKNSLFLSVLFIAIATGIKYLSILILPFIIIYALKNENVKNRIIKSLAYGMEFLILIFGFYLIYLKDINVLSGIFVQQNKYGRSIFLVLWQMLNGNEQILGYIKTILLVIFVIAYSMVVFKLLLKKDLSSIKFTSLLRKYNIFLVIFTFILITNFNPWYVIWLFPTIMWQKSINIKMIMYVSFGAILSYSVTYATKIDNETAGIPYLLIMVWTVIGMLLYDFIKKKNRIKKIEIKEIGE